MTDNILPQFDTIPKNQEEIEFSAKRKLKRTDLIKNLSYAITILALIATILDFIFDFDYDTENTNKILEYIESKKVGDKIEISNIDEIKNKFESLKDTNLLKYILISHRVLTLFLASILSLNLYYRLNTVGIEG